MGQKAGSKVMFTRDQKGVPLPVNYSGLTQREKDELEAFFH